MDFASFSNSSSCKTTLMTSNGREKKNVGAAKKAKAVAAVKLSTDPQSVAARQRRHRIRDRFKILQSLIPGGAKMDTASMLEEAIHYVNYLGKEEENSQLAIDQKAHSIRKLCPNYAPTQILEGGKINGKHFSFTSQEEFVRTGDISNKSVYDDGFGGLPKFGLPTLAPRFGDYAKIFCGFHLARSSSIPVLDLPIIDVEARFHFDIRSPDFNYSEIVENFSGLDFALSSNPLIRYKRVK
ncbi:unnamed protein product [Fraxinus pennsylvanica]|uniref:BHLH domain-containing protein n=1 Tax=Fraxinus pennsylvanica TaxID=56036 RepID=A0AAD1YZY8_9LAMI|nr:unnamed protein product [Fraxinus pennsylvanica]